MLGIVCITNHGYSLLIALLQTTIIIIHAIIGAVFYMDCIITPTITITSAPIKIIAAIISTGGITKCNNNLPFGLRFNIFSGENRNYDEKNKQHKNYFSHGIPLSKGIL
jgi:hypothetical protein